MYERSAIVLERYFENLLQYKKDCNIRKNFKNYCDLVDKLEKYQINYKKELNATKEYNESLKKIKVIQASQDKLYKKSAKLEYNRNLLFNNIDAKVDETRKCIEKIENEVEKNNEAMKETKESLIEALKEYNERKFELSKSKRCRKISENAYEETLEVAKSNFKGIKEEAVEVAKQFSKFDDTESIIIQLERNGKDEKIPFNQNAIEKSTFFAVDIVKKETASYLFIFEKMRRLLEEIEAGVAKISAHKKSLRNEKAKVDFLLAVKEYIIQFLDYERMTIIHGKKMHEKLMEEACNNFSEDVLQITNLFDLLEKETLGKATKKNYKDLYNKSYLLDIQQKDQKQKNANGISLINLNYWRINGIKEIYTIFYKNISEVFGKDIVEFDLPKEEDEDEIFQETVDSNKEENNVEIIEKKTSSKTPFELSEEEEDDDDDEQSSLSNENNESVESEENQFDIFGEKYKNIDVAETNLKIKQYTEELEKNNSVENFVDEENEVEETQTNNIEEINDDIEDEEDDLFEEDMPYEVEKEEENLFRQIKGVKRQKKGKNEIEDLEVTQEENSNNILNKIKKITNNRKKKSENNIW